MSQLEIDTSQNIVIEHPVASLAERILATLLDYIFLFAFAIILMILAADLNLRVLYYLAIIPFLFYDLLSELLMGGQTWGKKIVKIKVVKIDGTPTSFSAYFIRWVLRYAEIMITFGSLAAVVIVINRKGQRLGDLAANTAVVRLSKKLKKSSIYIELPENYEPMYPQVTLLNIQEIYTVRDLIDVIDSYSGTSSDLALVQKAFVVFQKKLGISTDQSHKIFFQTILKDYNYLSRKNI